MRAQEQRQQPVKLLLTITEAAQVLSLSRSLMYDLVLTGQVASLKIGRVRRVLMSSLYDYIECQLVAQRGA